MSKQKMSTKEFIEYTKKREKRLNLKSLLADDLKDKIEYKIQARKAHVLGENLERIWGGADSINRAVRPM